MNIRVFIPAVIIGVERGWISREDGENRIIITLKTLKSKRIKGLVPLHRSVLAVDGRTPITLS